MFEESDGRHGAKLADGELQQEDGDAQAEQHDGVRNEEGAAAILVAQVRKPPNVAQTCRQNGESEGYGRRSVISVE